MLPVVLNPAARRGRADAVVKAALGQLRAQGPQLRLIDEPTLADSMAAVTHLTAEGCERLVVIGGDGLVHHVLHAVAGTETIVGIVPAGTGNDLARALGLPRKPTDAVRAALGPAAALDAIDLGDGRWAASVATVGFAADVNARAEQLRWPRGAARYTVATMATLPSMRPRPLRLTLDDTAPVELDAALVAVANSAIFGGGMRIAPDADPTDGLLDVVTIGAVGRLELLASFARVFRGTHLAHRAVSAARANRIVIDSTGEPLVLWADGEPIGPLPVTLTARPGAWRVASVRVDPTGAGRP